MTSPEWRSSVGRSLGRKNCDCGSEGCRMWVSGDWRAGKLESWSAFCGGARGNGAYDATNINQQRPSHYQEIYIVVLLGYLGPPQYRFPWLDAGRHVVGSVVHLVTTRTTSIACLDLVINVWNPPSSTNHLVSFRMIYPRR